MNYYKLSKVWQEILCVSVIITHTDGQVVFFYKPGIFNGVSEALRFLAGLVSCSLLG